MGYLEKVTEEQRSQILKDIGYTEKTLQDDMERMRLWIKGQPHLPPSAQQETDSFLQTFLIGSKGRLEVCKEKLDRYYTTRTTLSYLYPMDPLDEGILRTQDTWWMASLPKPTPEGCRVTVISFCDPDPEKFNVTACAKRFFMIGEQKSREDGALAGEWAVVDTKNLTLAHVLKTPPTLIKEFFNFIQYVAPVRIKGIIIVNAPSFLETTLNTLVKPLLTKKLANRIFLYTDDGKLCLPKHFPKEILPSDFGGEAESLKKINDYWFESCISKRDWYLTFLAETTDESKRLQLKDNGDFLHGSFRQLTID